MDNEKLNLECVRFAIQTRHPERVAFAGRVHEWVKSVGKTELACEVLSMAVQSLPGGLKGDGALHFAQDLYTVVTNPLAKPAAVAKPEPSVPPATKATREAPSNPFTKGRRKKTVRKSTDSGVRFDG